MTCALQRASTDDADAIAALYIASRAEALPYLRRVYTDNEVLAWVRDVVLPQRETWVARFKGTLAGFVALMGDNVDQLYVRPEHHRCGIGRKLLEIAKARSSGRLVLYTFQRNGGARAFYESQGFRIVAMTDGSRNEEHEPDVCYEWSQTPVTMVRPKLN